MSQLIGELKKCTSFRDRIKIVALTSRKGLCVHDKISLLESSQLNDRCEDLNEKAKCEFRDDSLT
jgi:DEAD_2